MRKNIFQRKIFFILLIVILLIIVSYLLYSYTQNQNGGTYQPPSISFTPNQLLESATLAGNYLKSIVDDTGQFIYEYDPINNMKSTNYNILRHSGTIYSMLQLYNITYDNILLEKAEKAINYLLLQYLKPFDNQSMVIVENDKIKLGGNALAIIALAEHSKVTNKSENLKTMQDLAKFIVISQKENGEFISQRTYSDGEILDFVSLYYPGEAILSLCRLYSLDGNETWLDAAEKGAQYLINLRKDIPIDDLVHDHWLVIALNELYRYRNDSTYIEHSMDIATSIMNMQRDGVKHIPEYPEWLGSYYTPPTSTSTAIRSEALVAAYYLSKDYGDLSNLSSVLNAIKLGIYFQLKTQFNEDDVKDLQISQNAIGGFHESLDNYIIRIDYVQHNICSILGLYNILNLEN